MNAAAEIDWIRRPDGGISLRPDGTAEWFPGGMLNTCANAIDRHVAAGFGARTALIYDSAMTGQVRRFSYSAMLDEVSRTAGMLASFGVSKGDRVLIYMPMIPEAVFAMLACARLGAVHSVVFGGFAPAELAKRIDDAMPKLVVSASCGLEPGRVVPYKPLLDQALAQATFEVPACIVFQRTECLAELSAGRDHDWRASAARSKPATCVPVAASDPLYILYTSGTTGVPKGVVHDNGGHAVALSWSLPHVYGVQAGDTFWAASDIGWAVGHSFIVYAPLFLGCTTILYEGKPVGTPDAGAFWRVINQHGVDVFFTAPTAIRAIKQHDPDGAFFALHGTGRLRALFLAGERADPDTIGWAEGLLNLPVIDHWWQTELGWPALATCLGLAPSDNRSGSAGKPVPGYRFAVVDSESREVPPGQVGDIVIGLPLPPGALTSLWQRDDDFCTTYLSRHPGFYTTGDAGMIDEDGFVHVMSRIDDIINVAGHRLSTGGIEQVIAGHPAVAECAVVGGADKLKGMVPIGFVVIKNGVETQPELLCAEIVQRVRAELGPVASFKTVYLARQLPKTRSGKILRSTIRRIVDGEAVSPPATLDDPNAIAEIHRALTGR
jgi:propionyl-CoA synthetase